MNTFAESVRGKKVLVFGLGRQGGGSGDAEWLKRQNAIVRISDKDLELCPEGQTKDQIDWAEIIIKNPAVPDDHELILYAKELGKPVFTSVALFVKHSTVKTIGVTGTRGKSTTVALITKFLDTMYPGQIMSGGNIAGTSCLALFDDEENKKYVVLELSSFQLHNFHDLKVSPNIAIITNLYPDHLNRYPSMELYRKDKEAICAYQNEEDYCLYNADNEGAKEISAASKAIKVTYSAKEVEDWDTKLPGKHNRENIAAVAKLADVLKLDLGNVKSVVRDFDGLPFRIELIKTVGGVNYINDTTATTPTAAIKALSSVNGPIVWITGGHSKNLPFDDLLKAVEVNQNIKKIIILGSKFIPDYVERLKQIAGDKIEATVMSMDEAVKLSHKIAKEGDTVLMSPGFTSFDLFKNEFDRGRQFNEVVRSL